MEVYLCYCLPNTVPNDDPMTDSEGPCWLYDLIASIPSRKRRYLSFRLDARQLYASTNHLYKMAQEFFDQQKAMQIDAILSDTMRFKRLRTVRFGLLCNTRTRSPEQNIWKAAIASRFPRLHARRILG